MSWKDTYKVAALTPVIRHGSEVVTAVPDIGGPLTLDWDSVLPLELIREHTKTDDVPSVSDAQLLLYRKAGIESAEQYTGALFSESRSVTETVDRPWRKRDMMRGSYMHTVQYPIADGIAYLFGSRDGIGNSTLQTTPGSRNIRIPLVQTALDLGGPCCRPACDTGEGNYGMQIMYRAGYAKASAIPAGIIVGILKFIAWNITHPGDVFSAVQNTESVQAGILKGTNNVAWASGALELWRQYDPDAI